MLEKSLIYTPDPDSRSLGVRSVIEKAEEVISTERKHLEGEIKKESTFIFFSHALFTQLIFSNIVFGCQNLRVKSSAEIICVIHFKKCNNVKGCIVKSWIKLIQIYFPYPCFSSINYFEFVGRFAEMNII